MNRRKFAVSLLALLILALFGLGIWSYQQSVKKAQTQAAEQQADRLVRPHAPAFGPASAPVTIVEFFDPACETCRAFYPIVKDILRQYPQEVRLVIRYAPFHAGSDQVIQMLETARLQDKYQPVLEALLASQPQWADHGQPRIDLAEQQAQRAGLNIEKAKLDAQLADVQAVLKLDVEDLVALQITKTPSFFVNGRALPSFGEAQLRDLVADAVAQARAMPGK